MRPLCIVMVIAFFLGFCPPTKAAALPVSNPFAAMYDSDELPGEQAYEGPRADMRTDRFIVKYKDPSDSLADVRGVNAHATYRIGGAEERGGSLEVLQLSERVNPSELAGILQASGMGSRLEYIQPDFVMGFAGLSLTVEAIGGSGADDMREEDDGEQPEQDDEFSREGEASQDGAADDLPRVC